MKWHEFKALLIGLSPDTVLGRIVNIRAEEDEETLKNYTPEMRKIRDDWRKKMAKERDPKETEDYIEYIKQALITMAGGGKES